MVAPAVSLERALGNHLEPIALSLTGIVAAWTVVQLVLRESPRVRIPQL